MIKTTLARAKELRRVVEPLITLSKLEFRRSQATSILNFEKQRFDEKAFDIIGPKYADEPGGYTRILKCEPRPGDNAQ